jgi:hypothetical protein
MTKIEAFKSQFPAEFQWLNDGARRGNNFAESLLGAIFRWGALTERQLAAVRSNLDRVQNPPKGDTVETEALFEAFQRATASKLKRPRLHFGVYTVSKAPETGSNPGALYVKRDDGVYLGKVFRGQFFGSRDCDQTIGNEVKALIANPAEAVKAYGLRTGNCAICNRELTDPESVERGIGPICAEKWGF